MEQMMNFNYFDTQPSRNRHMKEKREQKLRKSIIQRYPLEQWKHSALDFQTGTHTSRTKKKIKTLRTSNELTHCEVN